MGVDDATCNAVVQAPASKSREADGYISRGLPLEEQANLPGLGIDTAVTSEREGQLILYKVTIFPP